MRPVAVEESEVLEILLLNVVKSEELRYPFVESEDCEMVKAPVEELYPRGAVAESEVELILLLKVWKSVLLR